MNGLNDEHSTIAILHIGGNGSAEPRVADWVTRNASDVQHGAALASPRADDATIVRVNQDGRHHIPYVPGPWTPSWLLSKRPVNGSGPRSSKRVLGHVVRIEGDSDRRGESLCSAARDRESSGGKDGGSCRVDLGERAAGLPSGNAKSLLSTCTKFDHFLWAAHESGSPGRIGCEFKHRKERP